MFITKDAATVARGSSSTGKATLPINAALDVTTPAERRTDSENAVHGQNATARKGTKPTASSPVIRDGKMVVNTTA
jgi:hypothetical protein